MHTIYIDVLITVNIFIDFFLILCTKKFLNIKASMLRMIIGSICGGLLSIIALFPPLKFGINILIDIATASIIIAVTFGFCEIKNFVRRTIVYFSFSFSFCGIMIFIYSSFKPKGMEIYNDVIYFNISPFVLIILTLACYYILNIIKRLTKGVSGGGTCNVEICVKKKHYSFCAKIDSGCNLKEPFSGDYVIITEHKIIDYYSPEEFSVRLIPFESLGGKGILKGFKPDMVIIDGKELADSVYIGICENILNGDVKALIPNEIIKNITVR